MKRHLTFTLALTLAASLSACSSSQKSEGDVSLEEIPAAEAGTDAVPVEGAEYQQLPPADGDPNALPPAEQVPPPDGSKASVEQVPPPGDPNQPVDPNALPPADPNQQAVTDPNALPPADPNAQPQQTAAVMDPNAAQQPAAPATDPNLAAQTAAVGGGGGSVENYTFQEGDTLMKIAFETYGDLYAWRKIYEANQDRISNPNAVAVGTVLRLEKPSMPPTIDRNGERYLIKYGDTLGTISNDVYGTRSKWRRLWENNKQLIRDPNKIFAGFYLYYTISNEEQQEADKLKMKSPAAPLAESTTPAVQQQSLQPLAPMSEQPPTETSLAPAPAGTEERAPAAAGG